MGQRRYTVTTDKIGKWLIEDVVGTVGLGAKNATRVTITDHQTGRSSSGAGSDYQEALRVACRKMDISVDSLDDATEP